MICSVCGGPNVTWRGPLSDLTHTECADCGGTNCQEPDDPDADAINAELEAQAEAEARAEAEAHWWQEAQAAEAEAAYWAGQGGEG